MSPKQPPKNTSHPIGPKQTPHPAGGKMPLGGTKKGGGPAHPVDGSQDAGGKSYPSTTFNSPKVGKGPSAKPNDGSQQPKGMK